MTNQCQIQERLFLCALFTAIMFNGKWPRVVLTVVVSTFQVSHAVSINVAIPVPLTARCTGCTASRASDISAAPIPIGAAAVIWAQVAEGCVASALVVSANERTGAVVVGTASPFADTTWTVWMAHCWNWRMTKKVSIWKWGKCPHL